MSWLSVSDEQRASNQAAHESPLGGAPGEERRPRTLRSRFLREATIVAVFYGLYTLTRDIHGQSTSVVSALANAQRVISLERHLGLFHEAALQHLFVKSRHFIEFWDGYYGTIHFIAVIGVLVYLFVRRPERYRLWRNTLAGATSLALIGFAFFPLLPPRLLPAKYGFTDTLRTVGGLWDFSSGAVDKVSNQFAAMPSLHTGWSLWCTLALLPCVKPLWGKVMLCAYPLATIFCIVVTANHYFVDAIGGITCVVTAYGAARWFERWSAGRPVLSAERLTRRAGASAAAGSTGSSSSEATTYS